MRTKRTKRTISKVLFFSSNATKFVDTSTEKLLGPTRGPPTRGLHHPLSSGQFWIFEVRFEIVFSGCIVVL